MSYPVRLMLATLLLAASVVSQVPESNLKGLKWREVGPYRGGRSAAVPESGEASMKVKARRVLEVRNFMMGAGLCENR